MEERNRILKDKLDTLYGCNVAAAACLVAAIIPFVNIIAVIVALGAAVIVFFTMLKLKDMHDDYHTAFMLSIINVAVNLIGSLMGGGVEVVLDITVSLIGLAQTYYIIRATNYFLEEMACNEVCERGHAAFRFYLVSHVIDIAVLLLGALLGRSGAGLTLVVALISLVVSIIGMIAYIKYLGAAKDCF